MAAANQPTCPQCSAQVDEGASTCWLCSAALATTPPAEPILAEVWAPPIADEPSADSYFAITLVLTCILLCVGVGTVAPGLGILLAILVTPALVRTHTVISRRKQRGSAVTSGEKAAVFAAALGAVVTAATAAATAFFATCVASCFGGLALSGGGRNFETLFGIGLAISAIVGLGAGFFVLVLIWRRRT